MLSGTSMSTPLISASAALFLEMLKIKKIKVIGNRVDLFKRVLLQTATVGSISDMSYSVARQGSGSINIDRLLTYFDSTTNQLEITPNSLQLNDKIQSHSITITNKGLVALKVIVKHLPAFSLRNNDTTFDVEKFASFNSITLPKSISLKPLQTKRIKIKIYPDRLLKKELNWVYSGYIQLNDYSIRYAGFKGDFSTIKLLSDPKFGLPYIKVNKNIYNKNNQTILTEFNNDVPMIHIRLLHYVKRLEVQVLSNNKTFLGIAIDQENIRKNLSRNPKYFWTAFNMTSVFENGSECVGCMRIKGNKWISIPNGLYYLNIVLYKMGSKHLTESWESPLLYVRRK